MNNSNLWPTILSAPARASQAKASGVLQSILSWRWLRVDQELRVLQRRDRSGNPHWYVYDPITQTSRRFWAEADLRRWLDTRHLAYPPLPKATGSAHLWPCLFHRPDNTL